MTYELPKREIKFRIFRKGDKYHKKGEMVYEFGGGRLDTRFTDELLYYSKESKENSALMQYTGLKDKKGKEIYEGDLVKYAGNSRYWTVYYDEKRLQFRMRCKGIEGEYSSYPLVGHSIEFEVVGNIFENPKLIDK